VPLIRYTYPPDVRLHGDQPVVVEDVEARVLCDDMRRAVRVTAGDLEELPKSDLADLAEQVGAEVKPRDSKGHFVKQIAEAEGQ
jgi:uncharacterized hydantoinase/oxoprolinase family protein